LLIDDLFVMKLLSKLFVARGLWNLGSSPET